MKYIPGFSARNTYRYKPDAGEYLYPPDTIPNQPTISIIMPVYNGQTKWLKSAIESVKVQIYPHWELCIVDDFSSDKKTIGFLSGCQESRIKVRFLTPHGGISTATNEAISICSGDFITFLDQDDELTPDALFEIVSIVNRFNPDLIYSDEDKFSDTLYGRHYIDAHFKPDYSPDLLLSHNYITHLMVIRRDLMAKIGKLRPEYDGAQDYDLALRAVERAERICHIRKVLYHWRYHPGSISHMAETRQRCSEAGRRVLEITIQRRGIDAAVKPTILPNYYRIVRRVIGEPCISIIIPFCDKPELLEKCLGSIISKTTYPDFEILGISNNSTDEKTFEMIERWPQIDHRVRFFEYNAPFNYSDINNHAAGLARGAYLLLLNNDVEIITPTWIESLLEHAQRKEIGAVGGKLYYPDGSVQHAGIVIGIKGFAGRPNRRFPGDSTGYFHRLVLTRNVSAVTGALMMVSKMKYQAIGGMDSVNFPISLNDVDFCLRLMEQGYWNVFTPYCEAIHAESVSRGFDSEPGKIFRFQEEIRYFASRHQDILESGDPFYNRNLSLDDENVRYSPPSRDLHDTGCYNGNGGI
jgi:O-antigen biosynthesis protein